MRPAGARRLPRSGPWSAVGVALRTLPRGILRGTQASTRHGGWHSSVHMRVGASTQPQGTQRGSGRGHFQATIWRDRASSHKLTMPRLWVGSDRLAEFAESKQSDGYEHPAQLDKRICMDIPPIIETRRAKRRTGAAYQHRRRRSLTGGHSITPMRVAWSTNARIACSCSLRIRSQDLPPSHGPIELRCPGNGRFTPMSAPSFPQAF